MKIATVVGARPQFVKCAPVSKAIRQVCREILIHTGQHYDTKMSRVFFEDLDLPVPDYNLEVGSGTHAFQTGEMLKRIEEILMREKAFCVLVYGDTNSTVAGALAGAKLNIPVAHVEAGLRSYNRRMPEEINRVVADHVSSLLFCPTVTAVENLRKEGITEGVDLVGDVMLDVLRESLPLARRRSTILEQLQVQGKKYYLATVHRAENTNDALRLKGIVTALERISRVHPVVWPIHPRTKRALNSVDWHRRSDSLLLIEPVSYLDMVMLEKEAIAILTDSGGVQKEAYWLGVRCVTLREESEWQETIESGWNTLAGSDPDRIWSALYSDRPPTASAVELSGNSATAPRIVESLMSIETTLT